MSAKVDTQATDTLTIDCPCEGTPHPDGDTVTLKSEFGYGDMADVEAGGFRLVPIKDKDGNDTVMSIVDAEAQHFALLNMAIRSWTFLEDNGSPMALGPANIRALHVDIGNAIGAKANDLYLAAKKRRELPNGSSGPSRRSSPEISPASTNRAQRRAAKRSTPRSSSAPAGA